MPTAGGWASFRRETSWPSSRRVDPGPFGPGHFARAIRPAVPGLGAARHLCPTCRPALRCGRQRQMPRGAPNGRGAAMNEQTKFDKGMGLLRIVLGAGFLYAGLEKVLQLGGGGPFNVAGFLKGATAGAIPGSTATQGVNPTHGFWVSLAANTDAVSAINFLVQFGEIAIGVALILGLATRFAGICGVVMMVLFYIA